MTDNPRPEDSSKLYATQLSVTAGCGQRCRRAAAAAAALFVADSGAVSIGRQQQQTHIASQSSLHVIASLPSTGASCGGSSACTTSTLCCQHVYGKRAIRSAEAFEPDFTSPEAEGHGRVHRGPVGGSRPALRCTGRGGPLLTLGVGAVAAIQREGLEELLRS